MTPRPIFPQRPDRPIHRFFEAHIEQGPILEELGLPVGIVSGAQAQRWYDATIIGSESHAGPTPMHSRKDAFMAAAELALAIESVALNHGPDGRGTVGTLSLQPFSRNVVPGRVQLTIDTRHPADEAIDQMEQDLRAEAKAIAQKRGVDIELTTFWNSPMTPFDADLIDSLEQCAAERDVPVTQLYSGAGHDAVYVASMGVPTAMLFVQTKDGISHNESESIREDHAIQGCQILCDAIVKELFND